MEKPLVSIIIPIYNVEKYLTQCLQSVIDQTYDNLEIICVNDGSPDKSGDIINKLAETDKRILAVSKKNGGLSYARNVGIDISHGSYLFFLDGDDYIAPECIEKLMKLTLETSSDISICQFNSFSSDIYIEAPTNQQADIITSSCRLYKLSYLDNKMRVTLNTAWGKLYSSNLFEEIRYPEGKINEDEFVTYKLFLRSQKVSFTHRELYGYRQRPGSITDKTEKDPGHLLELVDVFESRIDEFKECKHCKYLDLIVDDCLCQISSYYCFLTSKHYKGLLIKRYRNIFRKFKHELSSTMYLKRLLFYFFPKIYEFLAERSNKQKGSS